MRVRNQNQAISVQAIAGTEVVLLCLNAAGQATPGLLGFAITRRKGAGGRFRPIGGGREFAGVANSPALIQAFLWGDYAVDAGTTYTYRVVPMYGQPTALVKGEAVELTVTTEDPDDGTHAVHFNRGVAGSQAYSRLFGQYRKWYRVSQNGQPAAREYVKPEDVPNRAAWQWLSRGLEEALLAFIAQASGPEYSLRAAVYEFTYRPAIQAFVDALERGVDVKIIHHAPPESSYRLKQKTGAVTTVTYAGDDPPAVTYKRREVVQETQPDDVALAAGQAVSQIGLTDPAYLAAFDAMLIERQRTTISHNKFIVLLKDGQPLQVWTGSTNFTAGGLFGQSNVGHIVRDEGVAQKYLAYWEQLAADPPRRAKAGVAGLADWTAAATPDLAGPPPAGSITPIFSPRPDTTMLQWYADRLAAGRAIFFTAAFSVADEIFAKVTQPPAGAGEPPLRYLLLESNSGTMRAKYRAMAAHPENRIAWGDTYRTRPGDTDERPLLIETLTGLNDHVEYLHTKYLLIDPLSDDPIVISGSANFSRNSTIYNDENMLIVRGNTRLADIFLGEFMRLFNHFYARNQANTLPDEAFRARAYLQPDDSWAAAAYTPGTQAHTERLLFA